MDYDNGSTPYLNKREFRKTKHGVEKRAERKTELVEGSLLFYYFSRNFILCLQYWSGKGQGIFKQR